MDLAKLGKLGVWSPTDALSRPELIELAQRTEQLGYGVLWYPEARGHESFSLGSFLLAQTKTLILATGIANIYARDATAAKQGQHTLAKLSGGRFLMGLGVSHIPQVEAARGHSYGKPIATMRAYLDGMDAAAEIAPAVDSQPPTVLAALGPKMIALAAERCTGIHPYNVNPQHTAMARGITGPDAWICVQQKVLRITDPDRAREIARKSLANHLGLPNYRNNWIRLGFSEAELSGGGSDRFIDAMVAWGEDAAIKQRLAEHFAAGADHVCIQPLHPAGENRPDLATMEALAP